MRQPKSVPPGSDRFRLASLNLNLLSPLEALLTERSVTRAAQAEGVSQPTMSSALQQLRLYFSDELLIRNGNAYDLTPLAIRLLDKVALACAVTSSVFTAHREFSAATTMREFHLVMSDYTAAVFGEALSREIARTAPYARLYVGMINELETGYAASRRFYDGTIATTWTPFTGNDIAMAPLFNDRWVCVVDAESAAGQAGLLVPEDLACMRWVVPFSRGTSSPSVAPAVRQLSRFPFQPIIAVQVEGYCIVPDFLKKTDRIALMQERLAQKLQAVANIAILPCPHPTDEIEEALWWSKDRESDLEHRWLRERVMAAAASLGPKPSGNAIPDRLETI